MSNVMLEQSVRCTETLVIIADIGVRVFSYKFGNEMGETSTMTLTLSLNSLDAKHEK